MAATASALPPLSPRLGGAGEHEDSNISSPLSDVDDKDDDDDDIDHMQLDHDDEDHGKEDEKPKKSSNPTSDSDSVLSDAHSDLNSDGGNDTEAETERLFDTPQHQRQRDVVVDQFNQGQIFEHSPSKLRRTAALGNIDEHGDEDSVAADDASVASSHPPIESPSKPPPPKETVVEDETANDSQERKRKRSPSGDQSETEQPLRKRTSSVADNEVVAEKPAEENTLMQEAEDAEEPEEPEAPVPANDTSGSHSSAEEPAKPAGKQQGADTDGDATERETRAAKKSTRGSKRKTAAAPEADTEENSAGGQEAEPPTEGIDHDGDEEVDAATAHDEEMERKHAAYRDWTHIEEMFCIFRDRLYKDRLQRIDQEEQSLLAAEPTHPEYLNMKQCLDDRLEQKLREINKELEYRLKAHEKRAVAQRAQIWAQYFQAVREKREKTLEALNKEWYDVQTARRSAHSVDDYGLLFPKDPAQRVRNAISYNTEVSNLASIAKYEGFPSGPEMRGASAAEIEDDLAAIERSRNTRDKPVAQPREDFHTPGFNHLGPAGEQFLKDTPWANPNHSSHKLYAHTPPAMASRAESALPRPAPQQSHLPAAADIKAPFEGPATKPRSPALSGRLSESPELSRTKLHTNHHQMKRVGSLSGINRGSKAAAA